MYINDRMPMYEYTILVHNGIAQTGETLKTGEKMGEEFEAFEKLVIKEDAVR